jgi:hypothetical protein
MFYSSKKYVILFLALSLFLSISFTYAMPYPLSAKEEEDISVQKVTHMCNILHDNAINKFAALQEYLKKDPLAVNCLDKSGQSILHHILICNALENTEPLTFAKALITDTCTVINQPNYLENTPAHLAANKAAWFLIKKKHDLFSRVDYISLIEHMIDAQADFTTFKNKSGKTALEIIEESQKNASDGNKPYLDRIINIIKNTRSEPSKFQIDFISLLDSGNNSNTTIKIKNKNFKIHKEMLLVRCPALAMLN